MYKPLQRAILRAAAEREDGRVVISEVFDPNAAQAAVDALLAAGWLRSILAQRSVPTFSVESESHAGLEITEAGRAEAARLT